jgi:hypothetical protein
MTDSELAAYDLMSRTANNLADEVRRLNPSARMCPRCDTYPMVLIEEPEGEPRAGERYWTCPWDCDVEWQVDHPDDAPLEPTDDLEAARAKAERNNLTWYLWMGSVVVMDAGKRARLCSSGEFTVEGHNWETAPGCSGSMRAATDEEQELWSALP